MTALGVWRGVSLGILLIGVGFIVQSERITWHWILPLMAAMSFVNALLKRSWRFAPHPLLWCAGMSYTILSPTVTRWPAFFVLSGASVILAFLVGLVPHRPARPAVPPRPGDGVVLDAEVTRRD